MGSPKNYQVEIPPEDVATQLLSSPRKCWCEGWASMQAVGSEREISTAGILLKGARSRHCWKPPALCILCICCADKNQSNGNDIRTRSHPPLHQSVPDAYVPLNAHVGPHPLPQNCLKLERNRVTPYSSGSRAWLFLGESITCMCALLTLANIGPFPGSYFQAIAIGNFSRYYSL